MARLISPPKIDHLNLRQPMTKGEQKLFDLFDHSLDPEWEIYIQPHLNGLRPDFVLLNPKIAGLQLIFTGAAHSASEPGA